MTTTGASHMTLAANHHESLSLVASSTPLGSSWRLRRLVIGGHVLLDPIALARPAMRPKELAAITALMGRSRYMLEFGAGGSTTLALKLGVSRVIAVESDRVWIDRLRADEAAARAIADGRLQILHADIGPIATLGAPAKRNTWATWPSYALRPWPHIDCESLDLVLIDGRFRVACALHAVLRLRPSTIIAIHDFWNRHAYHRVLPFLNEIARCERLGVFHPKPDADRGEIERLLAHAAYEPD